MSWIREAWGGIRVARRWLVGGALVGGALLVNACHGSDDDTTGPPGTGGSGSGGSSATTIGSVNDLDGILAGEGRGYCARLFRCVEGNDDFMNIRALLQTPAACEKLLADINQHSFSLRDLRLQLNQGAMQIVPEKAQACLDEIASCNGPDSLSRGSCRDMFEGQVAQGAPCHRAEDCAGDAFCDVNSNCPGTCLARKASGESCQNNGECTQGDGYTFCDSSSAAGAVCRTLLVAPKAALGQSCTRHPAGAEKLSLCADTLWCAPVAGEPTTATLGVCQLPIPIGSACSGGGDVCSDGFCDKSTGVCRALSVLKRAGDPCDKATFRICDPVLGLGCSAEGSCEASGDGSQGSVCFSGDLQRLCNSGLYCQTGTVAGRGVCQPLLKAGASCEFGSSCETGNCRTTCQERTCSF